MRRGAFVAAAMLFASQASAEEPTTETFPPPETPPPILIDAAAPPPDHRARLSLEVGGGYAHRQIYDLAVDGGEFDVAFGAQRKNLAGYITFNALTGARDYGLGVHEYRLGFHIERLFDRLRLGVGGEFVTIALERATKRSSAYGGGFGLYALASFDVFRFGDGRPAAQPGLHLDDDRDALFLAAKFVVDLLRDENKGTSPVLWGPSFGAGVRF